MLIIACVLVVAVCTTGLSSRAAGTPASVVNEWSFEGQAVTAHVKNAPMRDVLKILADRVQVVSFCHEDMLDTPVSIDLDRVPPDEAFRRLFSRYNHFILYGDDGRIARIGVFPEGAMTMGEKGVWLVPDEEPTTVIIGAAPPGGEQDLLLPHLPLPPELKVERNVEPPGKATQYTEEEKKLLTIEKNCAPPGTTTDYTEEERQHLQIERDVAPPK